MRGRKKFAAILVAMAMVVAMIPATVFAAETTEYATIVLEIGDNTEVVTSDGTPLAEQLEQDEDGNYICEVGSTLEFNILVEAGYYLIWDCYNFEDAEDPESGFGGEGIPYDEESGLYSIDFDVAGTYTIMTVAEAETVTDSGWNEESLLACFGISAGSDYFAAGETPKASTIYTFTNMNLDEYMDEDYYYNLTYAEYMAVVDKYFANYVEMKDYLTECGQYDEATDAVRIYSGGFGGGVSWELKSVYEASDGTYILQGLYLVESTTAGNVYESYEWEGTKYYSNIEAAVELTLSENMEGDWKIVSYEKSTYYIEDYAGEELEGCGPVLMVVDENGGIYYPITVLDCSAAKINITSGAYTFENNDSLWYDYSEGFYWELELEDGYDCNVVAEKFDWSTLQRVTEAVGTSGYVRWDCAVTLITEPTALFQVEAPHAKVEVLQGLTDMGDGTYAYSQSACVELTVEAEDGYTVESVMVGDYEARLNSFGTYTAYPSFVPGKVVVTTSEIEDVVLESTEDSADTVTVTVSYEDAEQFDGLNLVVEKVEETVEEEAVTLIVKNIDSDVEEVYLLDIYFENQDGEEVAVNANMTVTVPIPEGWDTTRVAVYYVNSETGEVTDMNGVVSEDGKTISFVTTHFSNYALVQTAEETSEGGEEEKEKAPATGDMNSILLWAGMMTTAGYTVVSMKKREEN